MPEKTFPERLSETFWMEALRRTRVPGESFREDCVRLANAMAAEQLTQEIVLSRWMQLRWEECGRVVVRLAEDLQATLLQTEVPATFDTLEYLPWHAFWIDIRGAGIRNWHEESGYHDAHGIMLTRIDDVLNIAIHGTAKETSLMDELSDTDGLGDNTFAFLNIRTGDNLGEVLKRIPQGLASTWEGFDQAMRLALNLLLLWSVEGGILKGKEILPVAPKSPSKRKVRERKGESFLKYWKIGFREAALREQAARVAAAVRDAHEEGTEWHIAIVRGHFRTVWRKTRPAEGVATLQTKPDGAGGTWYATRKFVMPHPALRRGKAAKVTQVKAVR